MSSTIDWRKAPVGAIGHGIVGEFLPVWIGADWYEHDREDGGRYFFADMDARVTAWRRADVTNYVARPTESLAWNGEGLPPVGTICEFISSMEDDTDWHAELRSGMQVEIIAHFTVYNCDVAAFVFDHGRNCRQVEQAVAACFRPIRTPEQIAEEARSEAVRDMIITWKVPPVGSEFNFAYDRAAALYDAGYRKVEQP